MSPHNKIIFAVTCLLLLGAGAGAGAGLVAFRHSNTVVMSLLLLTWVICAVATALNDHLSMRKQEK